MMRKSPLKMWGEGVPGPGNRKSKAPEADEGRAVAVETGEVGLFGI